MKALALLALALAVTPAVAGDSQADYALSIKRHVEAYWHSPPAGGEPFCEVRIVQDRDGHILSHELLESCGSPAVNAAAHQAIVDADPLPLPADPGDFAATIILTFAPSLADQPDPTPAIRCDDEAEQTQWERLAQKHADSDIWQRLHALWLGLCAKTKRGEIGIKRANRIFDRQRDEAIRLYQERGREGPLQM